MLNVSTSHLPDKFRSTSRSMVRSRKDLVFKHHLRVRDPGSRYLVVRVALPRGFHRRRSLQLLFRHIYTCCIKPGRNPKASWVCGHWSQSEYVGGYAILLANKSSGAPFDVHNPSYNTSYDKRFSL